MSDKTAAELVSDYAKTRKEFKKHDNWPENETEYNQYIKMLTKTMRDIECAMEEWYDERQEQIKQR